jgi:hypothetical protein
VEVIPMNLYDAGWVIAIRCGEFRAMSFVPRAAVRCSQYQTPSRTKSAAIAAFEDFMSACGGDIGDWDTPNGELTPELEEALLEGWEVEAVVDPARYPETFQLLYTIDVMAEVLRDVAA